MTSLAKSYIRVHRDEQNRGRERDEQVAKRILHLSPSLVCMGSMMLISSLIFPLAKQAYFILEEIKPKCSIKVVVNFSLVEIDVVKDFLV